MQFYNDCYKSGAINEAEQDAKDIVEDIFNVKEYNERSFVAEMTPEDIVNVSFIKFDDDEDEEEEDENPFLEYSI